MKKLVRVTCIVCMHIILKKILLWDRISVPNNSGSVFDCVTLKLIIILLKIGSANIIMYDDMNSEYWTENAAWQCKEIFFKKKRENRQCKELINNIDGS